MSLEGHIKSRKNWSSIIGIIIVFLDLIFLLFVKYKNQGLSITNFDLFNTGNLFNFIFSILLIVGLTVNFLKDTSPVKSSVIYTYLTLITFFLILGVILGKLNISTPNFYIFEHPFDKVLIGGIFSIYQFLQFLFLFTVWLKLIGVGNFLFIKAILFSLFTVAALVIFALIFINNNLNIGKKNLFKKNPGNIAVVLGAAVWSQNKPSPSLSLRADEALRLYKSGYVGKIQLTGSNAPGELSEAEVAYNYLESKGMDTTDVYMENTTTSTIEQIHFIKNNLYNTGKFNKIIIVSDKYHLVRVREICRFYKLKASVAASSFSLKNSKLIYYEFHECIGLIVFWLFAL